MVLKIGIVIVFKQYIFLLYFEHRWTCVSACYSQRPHKPKPASLHHTKPQRHFIWFHFLLLFLINQIMPLPSYTECFRFTLYTLRAAGWKLLLTPTWSHHPPPPPNSTNHSPSNQQSAIIYLPSCCFKLALRNLSWSKKDKSMLTVICMTQKLFF